MLKITQLSPINLWRTEKVWTASAKGFLDIDMSQSDNSDVEVVEIKYYLKTNLFFACMNDCTLYLVWLYDHNYNLTLNS